VGAVKLVELPFVIVVGTKAAQFVPERHEMLPVVLEAPTNEAQKLVLEPWVSAIEFEAAAWEVPTRKSVMSAFTLAVITLLVEAPAPLVTTSVYCVVPFSGPELCGLCALVTGLPSSVAVILLPGVEEAALKTQLTLTEVAGSVVVVAWKTGPGPNPKALMTGSGSTVTLAVEVTVLPAAFVASTWKVQTVS
jgi:hypothetical protein